MPIKIWMISERDLRDNKIISDNSFLGKFQISDKSITLFNPNNNKNYTFLYPSKPCDRLIHYIWRNKIPDYFKEIISPPDKRE